MNKEFYFGYFGVYNRVGQRIAHASRIWESDKTPVEVYEQMARDIESQQVMPATTICEQFNKV